MTDTDARSETETQIAADQRENLLLLAFFQVTLRIGWIFKTESVIMPAVLDYLGGGGMIRGWLPLANRLCQSIPTVIAAAGISRAPSKKQLLFFTTSAMSLCFGSLFVAFSIFRESSWRLQGIFIAVYSIFFVATGLNQVVFGTIQGKLIPPERRGQLLLISNLVGVCLSVGAAAILIPRWVSADYAQFEWLFATSAIAFALAGGIILLVREPRDLPAADFKMRSLRERWSDAIAPFSKDANFRRLSLVAAMFGATIILFPHYQALGRDGQIGGDYRSLLVWLAIQNAGTAIFSMIVGPLADRCGNLLALRFALSGVTLAPLLAVAICKLEHQWAYPVVFAFVGLTPVVIRLLMNYTLEVSEKPEHPGYLAAISLVTGLPVLFSPIAGGLVDEFGFVPMFIGIGCCGVVGVAMTALLEEPRKRQS